MKTRTPFSNDHSGRMPARTESRYATLPMAALACMALALGACTTTGPRTGTDRRPAAQTTPATEKAVQELFDKGQSLSQQGDPQEAVAVYSEIEQRYGNDIDPALRNQIVTALFDNAANLGREGNLAAAVQVYAEIEQRYGDGDKSWAVWALLYQGELQRQLRNMKAAIAAFDRLDQRFGQERDEAIRPLVADALHKKAETLASTGDVKSAADTYDEIGRRFAEDRDVAFRQRALRALFAKGELLGKQGTGEETDTGVAWPTPTAGDSAAAIAVYDDIVRRFGRDSDPAIRNAVGSTLLKKSEALRLAGDNQGTIAVYDDIIERFGKDDTQVSRILVATVLFRKGLAQGRLNDVDAANASFDEVSRRFGLEADPRLRKIVNQANTARQKLIEETMPIHDN
ncbi:MAG: tetratricopeptide repeat protein [Azoarcus sp.]|jgi:TolA-binding protein|nr:tetratricopeptide repeat protein [Azoarcus sp.]